MGDRYDRPFFFHFKSISYPSMLFGMWFYCNRLEFDFGWQTHFYDNIILDQRAFENISIYILNNAAKREIDKFHTNK